MNKLDTLSSVTNSVIPLACPVSEGTPLSDGPTTVSSNVLFHFIHPKPVKINLNHCLLALSLCWTQIVVPLKTWEFSEVVTWLPAVEAHLHLTIYNSNEAAVVECDMSVFENEGIWKASIQQTDGHDAMLSFSLHSSYSFAYQMWRTLDLIRIRLSSFEWWELHIMSSKFSRWFGVSVDFCNSWCFDFCFESQWNVMRALSLLCRLG